MNTVRAGPQSGVLAHQIGPLGIVQQKYRLGIDDFAAIDHGKRLVERRFENLDVFALVSEATAARNPVRRSIRRGEETHPFGEDAWAHIGIEEKARLLDT